jgi:hypothetical protein
MHYEPERGRLATSESRDPVQPIDRDDLRPEDESTD